MLAKFSFDEIWCIDPFYLMDRLVNPLKTSKPEVVLYWILSPNTVSAELIAEQYGKSYLTF